MPLKYDLPETGLRTALKDYQEAALRCCGTTKERTRSSTCPTCGWRGYIDTMEGGWRTTCPKNYTTDEGNPTSLRPLLHIPYDAELFHELNTERYELGKTGKIMFNHPQGTHDDRFLGPGPRGVRSGAEPAIQHSSSQNRLDRVKGVPPSTAPAFYPNKIS